LLIRNRYAGTIEAIVDAGRLLKAIKDEPRKEMFRCEIADYILNTTVLSAMSKKEHDELEERAYAYYRMMFNEMMDNN